MHKRILLHLFFMILYSEGKKCQALHYMLTRAKKEMNDFYPRYKIGALTTRKKQKYETLNQAITKITAELQSTQDAILNSNEFKNLCKWDQQIYCAYFFDCLSYVDIAQKFSLDSTNIHRFIRDFSIPF